jgi:hypothetical protein
VGMDSRRKTIVLAVLAELEDADDRQPVTRSNPKASRQGKRMKAEKARRISTPPPPVFRKC